jgi:hypothetical protein
MTQSQGGAPGPIDRLGPRLLMLWAGLAIGVAFLATPAKFLAPSLSLAAALDVGRHTFAVYNHAELGLLGVMAFLGAWSRTRPRWYGALAVPAAVVLAETFWLLPALDLRTTAVIAGRPSSPDSGLHLAYIAAEGLKAVWLLGFGLGDDLRWPSWCPALRLVRALRARAL